MKRLTFIFLAILAASCTKKKDALPIEIFGGLKLGIHYNEEEKILTQHYSKSYTNFYYKGINVNNTKYYFVPVFLWNADSIVLKVDIPVYYSQTTVMSIKPIGVDKSLKFSEENGVCLSTNDSRNDKQMVDDMLKVLTEKYGPYKYQYDGFKNTGLNFDMGIDYYVWDIEDMKIRLIHNWSFHTYPTREDNQFRVHIQYALKDSTIKEYGLDKYASEADNF